MHRLQDGVNRFFFGGFDETAGVDDDGCRAFRLVDEFRAAGFKPAFDKFGINDIFRTAESDEVDFQFDRFLLLANFYHGIFLFVWQNAWA